MPPRPIQVQGSFLVWRSIPLNEQNPQAICNAIITSAQRLSIAHGSCHEGIKSGSRRPKLSMTAKLSLVAERTFGYKEPLGHNVYEGGCVVGVPIFQLLLMAVFVRRHRTCEAGWVKAGFTRRTATVAKTFLVKFSAKRLGLLEQGNSSMNQKYHDQIHLRLNTASRVSTRARLRRA